MLGDVGGDFGALSLRLGQHCRQNIATEGVMHHVGVEVEPKRIRGCHHLSQFRGERAERDARDTKPTQRYEQTACGNGVDTTLDGPLSKGAEHPGFLIVSVWK
jgi:hypothetical protein